jgi:hypothetical protein
LPRERDDSRQQRFTKEAVNDTVSFNPIVLELGKTGGSFTFIHNTTERVVGEGRLRTLRDLAARSGGAKELEEACQVAAGVLAENRHDLPFALLYLMAIEQVGMV